VTDSIPRRRLAVWIAAGVVLLDTATKALAVHFLADRGSVSVLGGALHLDLYRNFAGPHNTFEGHPVFVSVIALIGVAVIALATTRVRTLTAAITVGLLLGGGTGNLLDRLLRAPGPFRGGVVDWLRPAWSNGNMNLADLAIAAAVVVLVVGTAAVWWRDRAGANWSA
jgi:signal peptidase II